MSQTVTTGYNMGGNQSVPPAPADTLTLAQRFALVGIAHQATDAEVRRWALDTLRRGGEAQAPRP